MSRAIILQMQKKKTSHIFHFAMCVILAFPFGAVGVLGWLSMWMLCGLSNAIENWKLDRKIAVILDKEAVTR